MNYNNTKRKALSTLVLILVLIATGNTSKSTNKRVKMIQDLPEFNLEDSHGKWLMHMEIAHHNLKLGVKVGTHRSWIKGSVCQICSREGEKCQQKGSCFSSSSDPKVSCDSAYCSKSGQFESQDQGIYGIDTQIFCKVGKGQQALMPLVLANKITQNTTTMGDFSIMDSESSFNQGLLIMEDQKLKILNLKVQEERKKMIRDYSFSVKQAKVDESQFGLGRGLAIKIKNQDVSKFKQISIPETTGFPIDFSLEQLGITIPNRLLHLLERQLLSLYFPNNRCHFNSGKIKCRDQLQFGGLTSAILEFQLQSGTQLSLPVHLLLGSCTVRDCNFHINGHQQSHIIIGTIIWETLAFEWNLDSKQIFLYRLNNNWSSVYAQFSKLQSHHSFLVNLLILIYHIFKYIILTLLGLALFSLLVNCIFKWKNVLLYIRDILVKLRGRKKIANDEEQDTIGHVFQPSGRGRRVHRLPDQLEDEL